MFKEVHHRAPGNYDPDEACQESGIDFTNVPSLAVQSQKEEADINVIVRRFGVTGVLPNTQVPPMYGDFTGVSDYRSAQNLLIAAQKSFMALRADVRKRFDNDPAVMLDALESGKLTRADLVEMGFAEPVAEAVVPREAPAAEAAPEPAPSPVPAPAPSRGAPAKK